MILPPTRESMDEYRRRRLGYVRAMAGLPIEIANCLYRERIHPDDLPYIDDEALLTIRYLGPRRVAVIREHFPRDEATASPAPCNWVGEGTA